MGAIGIYLQENSTYGTLGTNTNYALGLLIFSQYLMVELLKINFSSEFLDKFGWTTGSQADPESGFFFNVGIFISPELDKHEH